MSPQGFTIRPVTTADVSGLVSNVLGAAGRVVAERRISEHHAGYRHMLVAELDGSIAGTVCTGGVWRQLPGSLRFFALDVGERFRNRGIGTALVHAVEERAMQLGLWQVNLEVSTDNEAAIRLYRRLGYEIIGEPVDATWTRPLPGGGIEQMTERQWVMLLRLTGVDTR